MIDQATRTLGALLYEDFELLDLFGPLEMFGNMQGAVQVRTVADRQGLVRSAQGPRVHADHGLEDCPPLDLLLVPGGIGTRAQVDDVRLIDWLRGRSGELEVAMTVCTGSALLAAAGLLDGRRATTNKMFFAWPETTWPAVRWVREARWVEDGKFWTSSGVAAGIDMALAVVSRLAGQETADLLATATEYDWHRDAGWDPFARVHGLV
jgi:transcriptional regulator GlxA family with amidase domain